jgi:hypothetical protein
MNMTVAKLDKLRACFEGVQYFEGIQYFKDHKFKTVEQAITEILKTDHNDKFKWSNWLIYHFLSKMDRIRYAVYAAEQVIGIFEKEYPEDKRPRKAIQAAKRYLKYPTRKIDPAVIFAARSAAWLTIDDSKTAAAAAGAAYAAAAATLYIYHAAKAAIYAANTITKGDVIDDKWTDYKNNKLFEKIIKYGVKLLK